MHVVIAGIIIMFNAVLGSSLPSGATAVINEAFDLNDNLQPVLINSLYMAGFVIGPLFWSPLSEHFGRKPVLVLTSAGLAVFTICCAVSPSFEALIAFRFLCGTMASAGNTLVAPLYADIYDDPDIRGKLITYYSTAGGGVPPLAPLMSAYASLAGWRLTFWIGSGLALVALPVVVTMPETFAPVLERRWDRKHAPHLTPVVSRSEAAAALGRDLREAFSRPAMMVVKESMVLFTSIYLALIYAILYLFFQFYPIIFTGMTSLRYSCPS